MTRLNLFITLICLFITLNTTSAKISGGPRGRFNGSFYGHHAHVSARHAHYSYHPPRHINFLCRYCANAIHYPVYHSSPPTYIYKFRESGSRYAVLFTGLSLYNLGRCCGNVQYQPNLYTPRSDEHCSMQIIDRKHFEETTIPCFIMSSFMEHSNQSKIIDSLSLKKDVNKTVPTEEPISFDIQTANIDVKPFVKDKNESELVVHREQECVIWHNVTIIKERHMIPCALLEEYADSMKPAGIPVYIWMPSVLGALVGIYIFCYCCCRKRDKKENIPLNQGGIYRYCSN